MSSVRVFAIALLSTTAVCAWQAQASAADLVLPPGTIEQDTQLPAVSGINGKWELDPGILTGGAGLRGDGSISLPLGERFGLQVDGMATWNGSLTLGGAVHAFTRDPSRYLFGVTAGIVRAPGATLGAVGPEAELYAGPFSLEGWAGVAGLDYVDPALLDKRGVFALGDLAYYATPDWRLALGGSYVLGDTALHLGTEYQFHGLGAPLSLTGDARVHAGGGSSFTVGLKGYFGGSDDGKSLQDRQRQDDPPDRALDLFGAAGSQLFDTAAATGSGAPNPHDDESCVAWAEYYDLPYSEYYEWDSEGGHCWLPI